MYIPYYTNILPHHSVNGLAWALGQVVLGMPGISAGLAVHQTNQPSRLVSHSCEIDLCKYFKPTDTPKVKLRLLQSAAIASDWKLSLGG